MIVDLHGNSKRGEIPPKGIKDKNVFDIQQGVAIVIGIKKRSRDKQDAIVHHVDLWGTREAKYEALLENTFRSLLPSRVIPTAPQYALNGREFSNIDYSDGFSTAEFFPKMTTGVQTSRDPVALGDTSQELVDRLEKICDPSTKTDDLRSKFFSSTSKKYPAGDTRDWKLDTQRQILSKLSIVDFVRPYAFRPMDNKLIAFHPALISWPRTDISRHIMYENLSLITARSNKKGVNHFYCSRYISDVKCGEATTGSTFAPLYLYPDEQDLDQTRRVNFDAKLWKKLQGLAKHPDHGTPDEVQTFDYIYGVLHCPAYRDTYAEFLKIDFPCIPWPASPEEFWDISAKGQQLRQLHLMDPATIGTTSYPFMTVDGAEGDNVVDKPAFEDGKIWINKTQYFDAIPPVS